MTFEEGAQAPDLSAVQVSPPPLMRHQHQPRFSRKVHLLAEAQNWRCAYCPTVMTMATTSRNKPTDATVDHVIALVAGGKKTWDNEVAACAACNSHKMEYSALLFWLLMVRERFNRRKVAGIMCSMTQKQRRKIIDRYNRDQRQQQAAA